MPKVVSLNIEHGKHLDRLQWLIESEKPDIICLQELREQDVSRVACWMNAPGKGVAYQHIAVPFMEDHDQAIGVGIIARRALTDTRICTLDGSPYTYRRQSKGFNECLIFASFTGKDGTCFRIATTHLNVTMLGEVTEAQMNSIRKLSQVAGTEGETHGGLLLTGDFNAPRGREAFSTLADTFIDGVPRRYQTSIDNELHLRGRENPINFVVDGLFHTDTYSLYDARMVSGVSDHKALVCHLSVGGRQFQRLQARA